MSTVSQLLALALLAQVLLTLGVYMLMARRRFQAGREGRITAQTYLVLRDEPADLARITRNVANQFELPVLFYVLGLMLLVLNVANWFDVLLAWAFVASRVAHASVHIGTENVMLRSRIFRAGIAIVLVLSLHVAVSVVWGIA